MARKSKYEECVKDKLDSIQGWARDGLTLQEIADNLGIALSTLCNYKNSYPELNEALKKGVDESLYTVENALFKSAIGYYYTEEEINKKTGQIETVRKYSKPNMTACIFYLKNKGNGKWKDKQEHDVNANVSQVIFTGEDDIKD
jgi:hypothetical protein